MSDCCITENILTQRVRNAMRYLGLLARTFCISGEIDLQIPL